MDLLFEGFSFDEFGNVKKKEIRKQVFDLG